MGPIQHLGNLVATGPSDSSPAPRKPGVQPVGDQAQLATVPLSAQVDQIHRTDPSSFQAVLSDAIRKLRVAAAGSSDPAEAAFLSGLADRFQRLSETSNTGAPPVPAGNS